MTVTIIRSRKKPLPIESLFKSVPEDDQFFSTKEEIVKRADLKWQKIRIQDFLNGAAFEFLSALDSIGPEEPIADSEFVALLIKYGVTAKDIRYLINKHPISKANEEVRNGGDYILKLLDGLDNFRSGVYNVLKENPGSKCPILKGITTLTTEDVPFDYFVQPSNGGF
tara:strand:+ start:552 stop:1055 length:504 start_codon:yes stop_codon:yes gene_type:complete